MKRYDNLFAKICTIENLRLADELARVGKKHTRGVRLFDKDREGNLQRLRDALLSGNYRTSRYTFFKVHDPKERIIARLPYYPDRIVDHAIMNICEPIFKALYTKDTYACIRGRGGHLARRRIKNTLRKDPKGTRYCLKMDIRHFYPSIDHGILKAIIRRKIKDARLLALLDEIIDSYLDGLPIGRYISQTLANLYLAYFDHEIKERLKVQYYFRYVDDIVILAGDKARLHALRLEVSALLAGLRLTMKPNYQVFPVEARGLDFLGYIFRRNYIRLRKRIKRNIFRRLSQLRRLGYTAREIRLAVGSYQGWLNYTDARHLTKTLNTFCYAEIFQV